MVAINASNSSFQGIVTKIFTFFFKHFSKFHKIFTKVFYGMISHAVGMDMKNSSDYKLLDKKVIAELAKLKERNTFFRALSFWVGFKKTTVYYEVAQRVSGVSKWSTKSLIKYAINNMICFSKFLQCLLINFPFIFTIFFVPNHR